MNTEQTQNTQTEVIPATTQQEFDRKTQATQAEENPACDPVGFEDFNLDDIEVIESKVFA